MTKKRTTRVTIQLAQVECIEATHCRNSSQDNAQGARFRSSSALLGERLHLAPVAEAVDEILAGAHREQVDAGEPEASQHVGEAQLIPGGEPHHLVEPEAHEEVRRGGVIPHNG